MKNLRARAFAWAATAALAGVCPAVVETTPDGAVAGAALSVLATCAGCALAFDLSGPRILALIPAGLAAATQGAGAAVILWSAGALVLLARLRGDGVRAQPAFSGRSLHLRRVMDMAPPGAEAHRALLEGFSGPEEDLRAAIAPLASLPPSVAIPVLARLSLHTDSITRLTARKRLELMLTALREEAESPTPERDARHAALRIRKAERLLVLADLAATDADERKRLLTSAAALATVAAADFPGNHHYAATAATAAARVGEADAARKLLARVSDPRRAWSTGRILRLCERMAPSRSAGGSRA